MGEKHTGLALRFISGKYQGNEFPLKANQEIIVGRGSEFDIVLVEDMVSRKHAKFVTGSDYVILQDLGSTNGSFVNGERIRKIRLREGDRILVGTSILKLVPYKGESIEDDLLSELDSPPLALPPHKETKQVAAFDPSKALPPPDMAPPSLDFIPRSPSSSASNSQLNAAAPSFGGSGAFAQAAPAPVSPVDDFDPPAPPPEFGQASMTGELSETPLADLLEIFVMGRKNAVLLVTQERRQGRLHFRNGRVVYATIGNDPTVQAVKAAMRILSWTTGTYGLYPPKDDAIHQEIDEDTLDLQKRAQRQSDQVRRHKQELPANTHNLKLAVPLRSPLRDLRPDYLDTLQLIHNYSVLDSILNKSQHSDVETYQHLAYLYKHSYIQAQ